MYTIGTIIDARSDGSYIYMSPDGVKNLDDIFELREEQEKDEEYLKHNIQYATFTN